MVARLQGVSPVNSLFIYCLTFPLPAVVCRRSHLRYLCLFAHNDVQLVLFFVLFVFVLCCIFGFVYLRLVYPMLPVSLDREFLIGA